MSYRKKGKQNKTRFYVYNVKFIRFLFSFLGYYSKYSLFRFPFYRRNDFLIIIIIITTSGRDKHPIERKVECLGKYCLLNGNARKMELEVSSFPRNLFVFLSKYQVKGLGFGSKVLFWSNEQFPSMKRFNQEKQTELSCLRDLF